MLKGKTIILGISGGIAAYKSAALASLLVKEGADVRTIMTANATQFISPLTFESLTGHKCVVDTFDRNFEFQVAHVSLAQKADAILVAPATANVLAKLAHGLADDMLSTTLLASRAPKIVAPAMNTGMYENPATRRNLSLLEADGFTIAHPASGRLACGDEGAGKMLEPELLLQYLQRACTSPKDMEGLKVLVTAGPTQEALDPVRYLTNHSSGKMGYALAKACAQRGASVTLVSGQTALTPPLFVHTVPVVSAQDMFEAVKDHHSRMDIIIKAAAVADYRPSFISDEKVKKSGDALSLPLARTRDILSFLGEQKPDGQFLCGFSMETQNLLENSRKKLLKKRLDMIVANHLKEPGAGFQTDTNKVTLIGKDFEKELPLLSKEEVSHQILTTILQQRKNSSLHD
ncbi:bifunctional phosphopantothenoylcysteine decarboxylase/phosphopantothenate--cysteine ligase CoaBC [Suipraeoptans intestinalis]|uniref:bifunctional phosphopantothenoylcysteine decarboxylase/phosphopantothenate--cysteine ligase CoaBC n=1 Tax=Suipraeoptans intestinalis TaxID=2606628 RepID=UPI0023F351AE|nr:bifunctional phosphopantothenoylcysteine decarboxylase/phosphopantothenate--cysteine ligase CoaBC [Suipraeoptans intestinalis]MDD7770403.1 bifunctional phosphopantothenoylcysteine decarboxylase/phosphopantothenate--cysteine ligase CoaBC [Suipraeoptans intestinalis]MDY3121371.1 bifunctional phosphopantothenoylcysteine decarboxylase/phosphopantothenate--cysteine ligase CoaBC [Suipraeoptans intestinalis]